MSKSKLFPFYNGYEWVAVTPTEIDSGTMHFTELSEVRQPKFVVGQKVVSISGGQWMPGEVTCVTFTPVKIGARGKGYTWTFDISFDAGGSARRFTEGVRDAGA